MVVVLVVREKYDEKKQRKKKFRLPRHFRASFRLFCSSDQAATLWKRASLSLEASHSRCKQRKRTLEPIRPRRNEAMGGRRGESEDDNDEIDEETVRLAAATLKDKATREERGETVTAMASERELLAATNPLTEEEEDDRAREEDIVRSDCESEKHKLVSTSFFAFACSLLPSLPPFFVASQRKVEVVQPLPPPAHLPNAMALALRTTSAVGARSATASGRAAAPRSLGPALPIRSARRTLLSSSSTSCAAIAAPPTNAPNHSVDFVSEIFWMFLSCSGSKMSSSSPRAGEGVANQLRSRSETGPSSRLVLNRRAVEATKNEKNAVASPVAPPPDWLLLLPFQLFSPSSTSSAAILLWYCDLERMMRVSDKGARPLRTKMRPIFQRRISDALRRSRSSLALSLLLALFHRHACAFGPEFHSVGADCITRAAGCRGVDLDASDWANRSARGNRGERAAAPS